MRRMIAVLMASAMLVGVLAAPAMASTSDDFVGFVAEQAEERRGNYNIIGNVVLALAESGDLTGDDVKALGSAEITAFLPTDFAFRRLAADLQGKRWWQVSEGSVIPFLADELGLPTIAEVVKYHIYAGGKVDYRTALSLDSDRRDGTSAFIKMYNGGDLGIDRRGPFLQLEDAGTAGFGTTNPWVVQRNVDGGNAIVHGISEVLLP